ncbi:hypothetical protein [Ornithinimicrobium kibberense]
MSDSPLPRPTRFPSTRPDLGRVLWDVRTGIQPLTCVVPWGSRSR